VKDPAGYVIAKNWAAPLEKNQARSMLFAGKKRPASGWDSGSCKATYTVERNGQVVLKRDLETTL